MNYGDSVNKKNLCLEIESGSSHLLMFLKIVLSFLERANMAANAVIVEQAAAARLLLASQALAKCREENNPFSPSNIFGPSRAQMWGPDPCLQQEKELAGATVDHQAAQSAAQIANAPTAQNLAAQPGTQLSNTWEPSELFDEVLQNTNYPELQSPWSPTSVENVMEMIAVEMELEDQEAWEQAGEELDKYRKNMLALHMWLPNHQTYVLSKPLSLKLKNQRWIGMWLP